MFGTYKFRTWHAEAAIIAAALAIPVVITSTIDVSAREWIGAIAVFITSRHMSVADRLREAEERRQDISVQSSENGQIHNHVDCVKWLDRYWVAKELLWIAYFLMLGAWSGLIGAGVFLVYPIWRRWYRSHKRSKL